MKRFMLLAIALSTGPMAEIASAGLTASAVITSTLDADGHDFDYSIKLTDAPTSSGPIGTFWFAWVPGEDFLDVKPLSENTPAGWGLKVTHAGASDGFALKWVAQSAAAEITAGNSLTFGFVSSESPTELRGDSQFFPGTPQTTATLYTGAPFSDAGTGIVASFASVPEPSSLLLLLSGGVAVVAARKFGRKGRA